MKRFCSAAEKIIDVLSYLGIAAMLGLMLLTFANTILRKFFSISILGTVEISQQLLVCIVWFGAAFCALNNGMIEVDIFHFPRLYVTVIQVITFVLCARTGYASIVKGIAMRVGNARTSMLAIPKFPFYYVVGVGYLLMALAIVAIIFRSYLEKDADAGAGEEKKDET